MVELNPDRISGTAEENEMSKSELLDELNLLTTRLAHAAEENEVLQKKVRLSDETSSRWAKKYAEFTKEQV